MPSSSQAPQHKPSNAQISSSSREPSIRSEYSSYSYHANDNGSKGKERRKEKDNDNDNTTCRKHNCRTHRQPRGENRGRIEEEDEPEEPTFVKGQAYPNHYCGWQKCHHTMTNDEPVFQAPDIMHLPVCHSRCWKSELKRVKREAAPAFAFEVPTCHRECYLTHIWKVQNPDKEVRDAVPLNRTLGERMGLGQLRHQMGNMFNRRAGNS